MTSSFAPCALDAAPSLANPVSFMRARNTHESAAGKSRSTDLNGFSMAIADHKLACLTA